MAAEGEREGAEEGGILSVAPKKTKEIILAPIRKASRRILGSFP